MTTLDDLFPSKYLKASDFPEPQVVTIKYVTNETIQGKDGKQDKSIVYFVELEKGLVLNKTNGNAIATLYGETIEGWYGKPITLLSELVDSFGSKVPGIRVALRKPAVAETHGHAKLLESYARLRAAAAANGVDLADYPEKLEANLSDHDLETINASLREVVNKALAG